MAKGIEDILKDWKENFSEKKWQEHISEERLATAVFEYSKHPDYHTIERHLDDCSLCRDMVSREQETNPIVQHYLSLPEDERDDYMEAVAEEQRRVFLESEEG